MVFVVISAKLLPSIAQSSDLVAQQLGLGKAGLRDATLILSMAVLAPLGEEMIFRGLIFRGLHDWLARSGRAWARRLAFIVPALVSSYLFAASHGGEGQDRQVVFLTLFGVIAAFVYWWTGSMYLAVFTHSVTNTINAVTLGISAGGFTTPLMWLLVAACPAIALGLMWALGRVLGPRGSTARRG